MQSKYWQEYWDNYYKFMAVYLGGLQEAYDDVDIKKEYLEVSRLFEPSMPPVGYDNNQNNNNSTQQDNNNLQQKRIPHQDSFFRFFCAVDSISLIRFS